MKRNKLIAILMMFAVVVCCTSVLFACDKGTTDTQENLRIFYDLSDGSQPVEIVFDKDNLESTILSIEVPSRAGYEFIGWSLEKDGEILTIDENTQIEDGATLYAKWRKTTLRIIYDNNDGSSPIEKVVDETNIKGATDEMKPTREGYNFKGWSLEKNGEILNIKADTILQDGTTLYAQWKIKTYTVFFMLEDKTTRVDLQSIEYGATATTPSEDKIAPHVPSNKVFIGWQDGNGNDFDESKPVTSNERYYAIIKDVTYTVKFQDGENVIKEVTGSIGTEIIAPLATDQPSKDGYNFSHWETEDGEKFEEGTLYSENETYYAVYTIDAPSAPTLSGPDDDAIIYGESATVNAKIQNPSDGITYSFVWYMNDTKLGEEGSITLEKLSAGEYTVRCEATASDGTLTSSKSSKTYTFNVEKATLTATIEDVNLTYGDVLPTFTPSYTGFKYEDDASVITGGEVSTGYNAGVSVGTYSASIKKLSADNYNIVGTVGDDKAIQATIYVAKKDISLKEGTKLATSKTYDGKAISYTFDAKDAVEFVGLLEGHSVSVSADSKGQVKAKGYTKDDIAVSYSILDAEGIDVIANYNVKISAEDVTLTIDKANIEYSKSDVTNLVYNGTNQTLPKFLSVSESVLDDCIVYYSLNENEITATSVPTFKNAVENAKLYFRIDAGENYNAETGYILVTIAKANISFSANNQSTTYGDKSFGLDKTYNVEKSDDLSIDKDEFTVTIDTAYEIGKNANTYDITIDVVAKNEGNFNISTTGATLTVGKAQLNVEMKGATISYGESLENVASCIQSIKGLYESDAQSEIINAYVDSSIYEPGKAVSTYEDAISCSLIDDTNYTLSLTKADLTVERKAISVEFFITEHGVSYGNDEYEDILDFNSYVTDTNTLFFEYSEYEQLSNDVKFTCETYQSKLSNVGEYPVSVSVDKDSETAKKYDITFTNGNQLVIVVYKRHVSPYLNNATVTYGEKLSDNALTYTIPEGEYDFLDKDKNDITYNHSYKQGEWGHFEWTIGIKNDNYEVGVPNMAHITVESRPVKISYTNNNIAQTADGKVTVTITNDMVSGGYAGDTFGGTIEIVTTTEGTFSHENTNAVSITPYAYRDGSDISGKYDFSYDISVVVKKIEIKHEVGNLTATYNGEPQKATLTLTGENQDKVNISYSYNNTTYTEMPSFTNAGTYVVSYTLTQEGKSSHTGDFTFVINKRSASISASTQSAVYGESFTLDASAYVKNGILDEDLASLNIAISCDYTVGKDVGSYPISVNYKANDNYNVTTTNSTLAVSAKQVTISGTGYTTVYGEQASSFTSFVIDDENAREYITIKPIGYTAGDWGTFKTSATSSSKNYAVKACTTVEMSVTARQITVKANNADMTYGADLPKFGYKITSGSLVGTDTLNVSYSSIDSLNVGTHDITPVVQKNERYTVTTQNGTLTITKASLTASLSEKQTITYGEDMPTYSISYNGFKYKDDKDVLKGELVIACDYKTMKKAGPFAVTASGLSADNYDITFVGSTLVVDKATLTITANAHDAITYGEALPTFTYTAEGFVNGDTDALLQGKVSFSCNYKQGNNAGEYEFNAQCADLDNYTVTIGSAQTLVVNKATYTAEQVNEALNKLNLTGTYSPTQTLANLNVKGFTWVDSTIVPTVANTDGYEAKYVGDSVNYNEYDQTVRIKITLAKADPNLHTDGSDFGADYTGSEILNYTDGILVKDDNTDPERGGLEYKHSLTYPVGVTKIIDGGMYTITYTLAETPNYNAGSLNVTFKVRAAQFNNIKYTVEDAIAEANKNKSGTVELIGNAFITGTVTINSGVTFILPCEGTYSKTAGTVTIADDYSDGGSNEHAYKTQSAKYTLTIPQNSTLSIAGGDIIVAGKLGKAGTGMEGQTSGSYSKIVNDGNIVMNSGKLDVRGYVMGTGVATFTGGSVYSPFVVRDFKGGSYTVYKAWLFNKISPFNEYEMINIQCKSIYHSGATLSAYADLYAGSQHNLTTVNMISSKGVIRLASGSYMIQEYNDTTHKSTLTLVGSITMGSLSLTVKASIFNETVNMADTYFPIPWTYDVNIGDGSTQTTLTLANDYKVLPGCTITIKKNATVNATSGSVIVYSNWTDTNTIQQYPSSKGTAGTLILDGGTLNAYNLGGIISATENGGTVKASKGVSVTAKEHNYEDSYKVTESARFEDGTELTKGKTYTYNGSSWVQA